MRSPAADISAYCAHKGYPLNNHPGHLNIVYLEGVNIDFTLNADTFDGWNDLRVVIDHSLPDKTPFIAFIQVATTEPGRSATLDPAAKKKGGVARMPFGYHKMKWVHGYHRSSSLRRTHPALIQRYGEVIMTHRDFNEDGKRTGDPISAAWGINHHGTSANAKPGVVGHYSAGCLVGLDWDKHLEFIELTKTDLRYVANRQFAYSCTIIAGDDFARFLKSKTASV